MSDGEPFRWTSAGPTYVNAPLGVGGYILFEIGGAPSWRFDVGSKCGDLALIEEDRC